MQQNGDKQCKKKQEIDTLTKFQCFDVVPQAEALKHGRSVKSKWVFKVKYEADGSLQRFKARLVAKGFTQVPGYDFYETYGPVFSYTSFRTLLALAEEKDPRRALEVVPRDLRLPCCDRSKRRSGMILFSTRMSSSGRCTRRTSPCRSSGCRSYPRGEGFEPGGTTPRWYS